MEMRADGRTAAGAVASAADDDDDHRRGSIAVTWARCKELLLDFHFNSDRIFHRIGFSIATKPWAWLLAALCLNVVCGFGLLLWKEESDQVELYMPIDSIFRKDAVWVKENFRDDLCYENLIVTAPNVLDPEVLRSVHRRS